MVIRHQIKTSIIERADDDLKTLLFVKEPKAEDFNYSPLILRVVNEYLLERGLGIGLGDINNKEIIDKYWRSAAFPIESDVLFRFIIGTESYPFLQLFIFFKNVGVRNKLYNDFDKITKLKRKNPLTYVATSYLEDTQMYDLLEECRAIVEEKGLKFNTEEIKVKEKEIIKQDVRIKYLVPDNLTFQCQRCNMCELPSNYSVNPIENLPEGNKETISINHRVCFPCNLPTLTFTEAEEISKRLKRELSEFTQPLLLIKDKLSNQTELIIGLKQKEGICIFQDLANHACSIHRFKPFNCLTYPILVSYEKNQITVECDFSCIGIGKGDKINLSKLTEISLKHFLETYNKGTFDIYKIEEIWGKNSYYFDKKRVTEDDIKIAKAAIFSVHES